MFILIFKFDTFTVIRFVPVKVRSLCVLKMPDKCNVCSKELSNNETVAKCVICAKSYHPACYREGSIQNLTKSKLKTWKCESCKKDSAKSNDEDSSDETKTILGAIEAMKTEINNNIDKKVGEVVESINKLTSELSKLQEQLLELEKKQEETDKRCAGLEQDNEDLRGALKKLHEHCIDQDQYSRCANIEIQGVPTSEGEDIYYCLEKIAGVLDVPFNREKDISIAHRIRLYSRKHAHPPIVVQFVSRSKREEWLSAARRKKQFNATEIVGTFSSSNVYINEHLTPHNKALLGRARYLRREKKLAFAGLFSGKVFIKSTEQSQTVRVFHLEDLDQFDS